MIGKRVLTVRSQELDKLFAFGCGEAGADADMLQCTRVIVQTQKQRAAGCAVTFLVPAESGNQAIAFTLMLYLEHHALIGLIRLRMRRRDHSIKAWTFEAPKPICGDGTVPGRGREMNGWLGFFQQRFQVLPASGEGVPHQVAVSETEQI